MRKRSREFRGQGGNMQYYCRGCGQALAPDWHGQFHPECLKADKRKRTQQKRAEEREKFEAWLRRISCPACGINFRNARELFRGGHGQRLADSTGLPLPPAPRVVRSKAQLQEHNNPTL